MRVICSAADAVLAFPEVITAKSKKKFWVQFYFDSAWDSMMRTATFVNGDAERSRVLDDSGVCEIPWEVIDEPGYLHVGVTGINTAGAVLPTVWCSLGRVRQGTEIGELAKEPTPTLYEQVVALTMAAADSADGAAASALEAQEIARALEEAAESGRFNGITPHIGENGNWWIGDQDTGVFAGGDGGSDDISEEDIQRAVEAYMAENPVGFPPGGTTGQVLAKASDEEGALMWKDPITYAEVSNEQGGKTVTIGGV